MATFTGTLDCGDGAVTLDGKLLRKATGGNTPERNAFMAVGCMGTDGQLATVSGREMPDGSILLDADDDADDEEKEG